MTTNRLYEVRLRFPGNRLRTVTVAARNLTQAGALAAPLGTPATVESITTIN
jgi:hypothetical protein